MASFQYLLALTSVKNSNMIYVKSAYTSSPSDMHLKSILMTVITKLKPYLDTVLLGEHQYCCSD
jgi:hypothetical protein